MSALTLYRANGVSSFIPHVLLKELMIPFTPVIMQSGPNRWEAADGSLDNTNYRNIHPQGYVPALQVDGVIITELPAIITYIASSSTGKTNLLGDDKIERAKVVEWMAWLSGTVHAQGVSMYFRPERFTDDLSQYESVRSKGKAAVLKGLRRIDQNLEGNVHPVGVNETVVDFILPMFWYSSMRIGIPNLQETFPHLSNLVKKMEKKASLREAAELEGLELYFG
ncbi:hypothetical protein N5P37_010976 [Trichoderma harzianum]|uniref:GST N-terminal domain-containing protein n=1 Tax=Trichoderma harzianum CBS 226.95 TaxID=983964 RepID=A0A2T4A1R6_TRIHA|nr:hypothetical protein M431DRAFT_541076 [Trichoderma harzianum CBS 226.95]KAK0756503.1 hypothetical protein N5P37_010976 [Trichoderma harzianum]PKK51372.1 hypothetical protein CI102_3885 [Trichoderma harzianum]PTB51006.1 hypothetical protein M431DRAFT_541076 [Trichoderma harzianum CBS 226.95]